MANIVIIGAGVMGTALAVPPSSTGNHRVSLIGSPLDDDIIHSIQTNRHHPTLNTNIPDAVDAIHLDDVSEDTLRSADVVVIGVSSAGVSWIMQYLQEAQVTPNVLALVTKGLVPNADVDAPPLTYADALAASMTQPAGRIVGIGGPCIARELALGFPTRVTFASADESLATDTRQLFQTSYYRITTHSNIVALEACAALKNFLCIGVSAMFSAYPLGDSHAKNPLAALYNQAVRELFLLSNWISHASSAHASARANTDDHVAFDLAGMGDLHVTVGGGRNSRLGMHLGSGKILSHVLGNDMAGVTVEGVDTGRSLLSGFKAACKSGVLEVAQLPLTAAILDCIENDRAFAFDFEQLPG